MAVQYSNAQIVTSGLVLALDAGDRNSYPGSGTAWRDLSGNNYSETLTNGPTFNIANGGSIVFDGTDDYAASVNLGAITSFTVITWFYPTSVANYKNVLDCNYAYNGTTGNIGPRLEMDGTGNLSWAYSNITNNNNSFYFQEVITSGLSANVWHSAAITYSSSGNSSITYYNGINTGKSRTTFGSPTGFVGVMNTVNVGRGFSLVTTSERYFAGRVASVQIYNRALSADEISQNYNAQKQRFGL